MTRLIHRPIEVRSWRDGEPLSFQDGEDVHQICEVIDRWLEMGNWWEGEGSRKLLRVLTEQNFVFDLEGTGQNWYIYRVWD